MIVKSVGILSVGKLLGCFYGLLGLLFGIGFSLFSVLAALIGGQNGGPALFVGAAAFIVAPIAYGLIGFVAGAIGAALYNVVASITGGIELELTAEVKDRRERDQF